MKIVNISRPKEKTLVKNLKPGTLYRIEAQTHKQVELENRVFMVVQYHQGFIINQGAPYSIEMSNGSVVPWNGHQDLTAVVLDGKLEVSIK